MANEVQIDFEMTNYLELMKKNIKRLQIAIASDMQTNIGLRFENEGAYNGHAKWKDLKSGLNLRRAKNGLQTRQILRKSGALRNSLAPASADGTAGANGYVHLGGDLGEVEVRVGTSLKYARIHNEGGVISHPGTANGFGRGIKIKPHSIQMPRRNYTDWSPADQANMEETVKNTIEAILNGG